MKIRRTTGPPRRTSRQWTKLFNRYSVAILSVLARERMDLACLYVGVRKLLGVRATSTFTMHDLESCLWFLRFTTSKTGTVRKNDPRGS